MLGKPECAAALIWGNRTKKSGENSAKISIPDACRVSCGPWQRKATACIVSYQAFRIPHREHLLVALVASVSLGTEVWAAQVPAWLCAPCHLPLYLPGVEPSI